MFVTNILNALGEDYIFINSVLVYLNEEDGSPNFIPDTGDGYDFLFVPGNTKLQVVVTDHFYEVSLQKEDGSFEFTRHLGSAAEIPGAMLSIIDLDVEEKRAEHAAALTAGHVNSPEALRSPKML